MQPRPKVLLVEANLVDETLTRRAIAASGFDCEVEVAHDGVEACQILIDRGDPPPSLILLELNLPKLSGFEVLTRIRSHEGTKRVPLVVFSGSAKPTDVDKSFDLCANSYVLKDKNFDLYETRLKLILYYWFAVNRNVYT